MKSKILFISLCVALIFASCNKWLDVNSKTEIPSDEHFSSETGFKDGVIGVYVKLAKPELYSKTLTWHVNEFMSQNYAVVAGATDLNLPKYMYNIAPFLSYGNSIWLNCYEVIANINNILRYEEENSSVMSPITDSLVKGEMLGVRAFVHFDLLRMFGKGDLARRPQLMNELTIPYSKDFNKMAPEQVTNREFIDNLKKDITESIDYLEVDSYNKKKPDSYYAQDTIGRFLDKNTYNRRYRMNYYAAKALYARILMWEGTPESKALALEVSEGLIDECFKTNAVSWSSTSSVNGAEWWTSNLLFKDEHLFALSVEKFAQIQETRKNGVNNWFDASSPNSMYDVVYLTKAKAEEIFEVPGVGSADWRYTNCLNPESSTLANYSIVKLRQHKDQTFAYSRIMPLIRITEMFYIAAECRMEPGVNYDRDKALTYLNTVRNHRNISEGNNLSSDLTDNEIIDEITKEYRKELVGEGQIFFYYKRKGFETIPSFGDIMDDMKYQYPMPDDEIILGGRQ